MSIKKENAFKQLNIDFNNYSSLVLQQLKSLEKIVNTAETTIPEEVYNNIKAVEKEIDKYEVKLSDDVISIIMLYSPVASELRQIIAYYRISLNIERIGDKIINVVKYINRIENPKMYIGFAETISDILTISISMVEKSLLAFTNNDLDYAIWTIKNDDVVDELNHSFIKKAIKKNSAKIKTQEELSEFIYLRSIVSNIERIADNATNIAEAAIYSIEGKDVRHKKTINKKDN